MPDTSDGFVDGELTRCVEACLAGLTPRYRTALVLKDLHGLSHAEIAEVMDIHQGAARVLLHRARAAFRRAFSSSAPAGASGIPMLGLAAFLPDLPVPASLQAPPAFASVVPQAAWPAGPSFDPAGAAAGAGHAGLSAAASAASVPIATAPVASLPLAVAPVAPVAPVGLLAGLGGAAGVKLAIAAIAVLAATGGGPAARHTGMSATSVDDRTGRADTAAVTTQVARPAGEPRSYGQRVGEQFRVAGSYRGDPDGGATATRNGDDAGGGATDAGTGGSSAGGSAGVTNSIGNGAAGQVNGLSHHGSTGGTGTTSGGGTTTGSGGTTTGSGATDAGSTGAGETGAGGADPTAGGDAGSGNGTGSSGGG